MANCFFCDEFVGEDVRDGGLKGRTVGNKDICEQCLGELKHWLNAALPRAPSMREKKLQSDTDEDSANSESAASGEIIVDEEPLDDETKDNPFSSSPKV